jgi:hypothetical protein
MTAAAAAGNRREEPALPAGCGGEEAEGGAGVVRQDHGEENS